jgi:hypothetical protein
MHPYDAAAPQVITEIELHSVRLLSYDTIADFLSAIASYVCDRKRRGVTTLPPPRASLLSAVIRASNKPVNDPPQCSHDDVNRKTSAQRKQCYRPISLLVLPGRGYRGVLIPGVEKRHRDTLEVDRVFI